MVAILNGLITLLQWLARGRQEMSSVAMTRSRYTMVRIRCFNVMTIGDYSVQIYRSAYNLGSNLGDIVVWEQLEAQQPDV